MTEIGWLTGTKDASGTVTQALDEGDANFEAELHPVSTRIYYREDGEKKEVKRTIDRNRAVVRMDTLEPLAVVGTDFRPVQHLEAFGTLDTLVAEGRMQIEKIRLLQGGRKVMVVTSMPDKLVIAGEPITRYQAWFNGHDGKTAVMMISVPTRDFCTNAIPGALSKAGSYRIKHTKRAHIRLAENQEAIFGVRGEEAELESLDAELDEVRADLARREQMGLKEEAMNVLDKEAKYVMELQQIGDEMAGRKMSARQFDAFLKKLVPIDESVGKNGVAMREEKRQDIRSIWLSADNLGNVQDTAWGAFNAVVEWSDHYRRYSNIDSKILSIVGGNKEVKKALALLRN